MTLLETLHFALKYLTSIGRGTDGESGKEGVEHLWSDKSVKLLHKYQRIEYTNTKELNT